MNPLHLRSFGLGSVIADSFGLIFFRPMPVTLRVRWHAVRFQNEYASRTAKRHAKTQWTVVIYPIDNTKTTTMRHTFGSRFLPSARVRLDEDISRRGNRTNWDTANPRSLPSTRCSQKNTLEPCCDHRRTDL